MDRRVIPEQINRIKQTTLHAFNMTDSPTPAVDVRNGRVLHFSNLLHCDDVTMVFDTPKPGHGLVMLRHFQTAWTAYWVDMRPFELPIDRFICASPSDLVQSFVFGTPMIATRDRNKEHANLMHLINQVKPLLISSRKEAIDHD